MNEKLTKNPVYAKRISKIRSRTVEPVLGSLINFINLKKINSRGMAGANKHVMMAAITYNLKKLLKLSRPKLLSLQMSTPKIKVGKEFLIYIFFCSKCI